ncbi:MAG: beta-propeller domain-containing protein [Clostridia bacterium]|nr:beta-propeller domain-containing protein [Clostridia bacterium]
MKIKKTLDVIGQIDDRYVEEASPNNAKNIFKENKKQKWQKRRWMRYGFIAVACSLFIALNLWLFIPYNTSPPSVAEFSSSRYYSVIQKINQVQFKKPRYKNNFQKLINGGFFPFKASMGDIGAPENGEYVETTDNQVDGIIEADLIKRTDKYAFYLNRNTVNVYSLEKENSALITSYKIEVYAEYLETEGEMFLSEDAKRLSVIVPYSKKGSNQRFLDVVSLSVENPQNITEIGRITLNSAYNTSRLVNGDLLIVGSYTVWSGVDFNCQEDYIPRITVGGETTYIPMEDIVAPDVLTSSSYTVLCKIDEKSLEVDDFMAFLSYTQAVYVSHDFVYVGRSFSLEYVKTKNTSLHVDKTEIIPIGYTGEGFEVEKSVVVDGHVNDQYSMDEFDGNLRVVTTTTQSEYYSDGRYNSFISSKINASLFVVNLTDMQIVASVERFAPEGESVRSVRFEKNTVYVCTSVYVSDPVFFFDLTDLKDIKIKDTGTIAGFSTSLVNFGEGYLLGVGVGENGQDLKIEIYAEEQDGVVSVCKYEQNVGHSSSYKSYYIDREKKMIGLGTWHHVSGDCEYLLLSFNGESLTVVLNVPINTDSYFVRMVLIDGYAYIFGQNEFLVKKVV